MSVEAMKSLLEKAQNDEAFATGLVEAVGGSEGDAAINAVVSYGTGNGFDITFEDAAEAHQQFLSHFEPSESDLDDADLENVSGGISETIEGFKKMPGMARDTKVAVTGMARDPVGYTKDTFNGVTGMFRHW